jgi:hypothetical protein
LATGVAKALLPHTLFATPQVCRILMLNLPRKDLGLKPQWLPSEQEIANATAIFQGA